METEYEETYGQNGGCQPMAILTFGNGFEPVFKEVKSISRVYVST